MYFIYLFFFIVLQQTGYSTELPLSCTREKEDSHTLYIHCIYCSLVSFPPLSKVISVVRSILLHKRLGSFSCIQSTVLTTDCGFSRNSVLNIAMLSISFLVITMVTFIKQAEGAWYSTKYYTYIILLYSRKTLWYRNYYFPFLAVLAFGWLIHI